MAEREKNTRGDESGTSENAMHDNPVGQSTADQDAMELGIDTGTATPKAALSPEAAEEAKLLRRLQMMMNMVMGVIAQDNTLGYDDAAAMVADARNAALAMFPGKELAYDLIWKPRFQRLMRERFRLV